MRRALPGLLLALAVLAGCSDPPPARVGVGSSLDTIHPDRRFEGAERATITAARNEIESFQIAIQALGQSVEGVTVSLAEPLRGPAGTIPRDNVAIFREGYIDIKAPSDLEGSPGRWPDALIPAVDTFFHEQRNAFPIDIPVRENRAIWVDVLVPPHQAPGEYTGAIDIEGDDGFHRSVDVELTVHPFTLPSTATLETAFNTGRGTCTAHYGEAGCPPDQDRTWEMKALYVRAALENRISISTPAYEAPSPAQRDRFRRIVLPLINGTLPLNLAGARLTTIAVQPDEFLGDWKREAEAGGFVSRAFLYSCDEPQADPATWQDCKDSQRRAARTWPELPALVTASIRQAREFDALDGIDILSPVINLLDDKPGASEYAGDQRPAYDAFLGAGNRRLWTYVACVSHGCEGDEGGLDPYWRGWPGYVIDEPGTEHRAMGMLAFLNRATGELYFDVGYDLATAWTDQREFGGNGEGTLFYPGTPDRIGGVHDIPVESIRLKRIRDGHEDYEYLHQLEQRGDGDEARAIVRELFPHPYETDVPAERFATARSRLADLLVRPR